MNQKKSCLNVEVPLVDEEEDEAISAFTTIIKQECEPKSIDSFVGIRFTVRTSASNIIRNSMEAAESGAYTIENAEKVPSEVSEAITVLKATVGMEEIKAAEDVLKLLQKELKLMLKQLFPSI